MPNKISTKGGFLGKRLLILTAHPDDESFCVSGSIVENKRSGGRACVVCATAGERGKSHLKKSVTASQLKKMRRQELRQVSKFLKVDALRILNFPDGSVQNFIGELVKKVLPVAQKWKPDFILSFGADGVSGHLDHIAVSEAAKKISKTLGIAFVAFAAPPYLSKNTRHLIGRRKHGVYAADLVHQKPNLKIKVDPKIKLKAMRFHASQMSSGGPFGKMSQKGQQEILGFEYFVV